jgi:hypothetical protein
MKQGEALVLGVLVLVVLRRKGIQKEPDNLRTALHFGTYLTSLSASPHQKGSSTEVLVLKKVLCNSPELYVLPTYACH